MSEADRASRFKRLITAHELHLFFRRLLEEGWTIEPEDLAHISPYLTERINRFGEYSTYELGIQPEAYDPKQDVDFTPLREQDLAAAGFGHAA